MDSQYLRAALGPCLTQGLAAVAERRPADPIEYLAHWLYQFDRDQELERQHRAETEELDAETEIYLKEKAIQEQLNAELEEIQQIYRNRLLTEQTAGGPDQPSLSAVSAPMEKSPAEMLVVGWRKSPTPDTQLMESLSSLVPPDWLGEPELETVKEEELKKSNEPSAGSQPEEEEDDAAEEGDGPEGR